MTNKLSMRLGIGKPAATVEKPTESPKPAAKPAPAQPVAAASLDSVAMLSALNIDDIQPVRDPAAAAASAVRARLQGETDVKAPVRNIELIAQLEADAEAAVDSDPALAKQLLSEAKASRSFIQLLDGVYTLFDDPELMGSAVSSIMIELKSNPQYINESDWTKSLVVPDDVRLWIQGMRESSGLKRIEKTAAKAKRASSKAAPKLKVDWGDDLDVLGLGDLD